MNYLQVIYKLFTISCLTIFLLSCSKKEADLQTSTENIPDRIIFESIDEYDELVQNPDETGEALQKIAISSSDPSDTIETLGDSDTLYPEFLQQILNKDRIVQIGNWLIKVDLLNERVLVLETEYSENYQKLVDNDLSFEHIQIFSTEDDVLDLLKAGEQSPTMKVSGLFCSESGAQRKKSSGYKYIDSGRRLDCKVVYQRAGIYFSLQGKVIHETKTGFFGSWTGICSCFGNEAINLEYNYIYKPKCKSQVASNGSTSTNTSYSLNKRPYQSTRGLNKYKYTCTFSLNNVSNSEKTLEIKHGY